MSERRDHKLDDLPEGTLLLADFARRCGVSPTAATRHAIRGIALIPGTQKTARARLQATRFHGNNARCYVTLEQQSKALEFWDKHGVPHSKPENVSVEAG